MVVIMRVRRPRVIVVVPMGLFVIVIPGVHSRESMPRKAAIRILHPPSLRSKRNDRTII
jgi:hypothetical protein